MVTPAEGRRGHGARGHVDVVAAAGHVAVDAQLAGVGPHVGEGDGGRLLHHVAELPGEGQPGSPSITLASMNSTSPPVPVTAGRSPRPGRQSLGRLEEGF